MGGNLTGLEGCIDRRLVYVPPPGVVRTMSAVVDSSSVVGFLLKGNFRDRIRDFALLPPVLFPPAELVSLLLLLLPPPPPPALPLMGNFFIKMPAGETRLRGKLGLGLLPPTLTTTSA